MRECSLNVIKGIIEHITQFIHTIQGNIGSEKADKMNPYKNLNIMHD